MMMENCGITPVYNVDGNGNNANSWGDGGWFWIIFLFFIMAWGGNWGSGFGGFNGGSTNSPGFQGYATRSDINDGFLFNNIQNGINGLQTQLCNCCSDINSNISNGFANTNLGLSQGFNSVQAGIANLGYSLQDCCCQINRNIDGVQYEMAKNTSDIVNAGNANTQRIIDAITADKIDSLRTELQSAQLQLSNNAQTQALVNQLKPVPVPAYLTCSPYTAYPTGNIFGNACGCGCGTTCC